MTKQRGFTAVEGIVAVFIVAAVALAGWYVVQRMNADDKTNTPSASEQASGTQTPAAPEMADTADLDTALKTLENTNIDATSSDSRELDQELQAF